RLARFYFPRDAHTPSSRLCTRERLAGAAAVVLRQFTLCLGSCDLCAQVALLNIVPLGGLGEVGMNCLALESSDGILVIGCGVMFPNPSFGVDVIRPDFTYLAERRDQIRGVVITHGHEDHIGALPYLLQALRVPVYAPPYALALIRARLAEHPE